MNKEYDNKILIDSSSSLFSDPDPVKASIKNGKVTRTLKEINSQGVSGIAIGVYMFSKSAISDLLETINDDIKRSDDDKSLYYSVDSILDKHDVVPVYCKKKEWFDIDTPDELEMARLYMREHLSEYM